MPKCKDCKNEFRTQLRFHHDPPKSKIFKENGEKYFIDKDGKKKMVFLNQKNRKLCRKCHLKADREWGVRVPKIKRKGGGYLQ